MTTKGGESPRTSSIWPQWHENKPFALVLILIGSFLVVFLMAKVDKIQKETAQIGNTITIDGQGSAIGKPDVATVTIGVDTKADDVAGAQEQNSTTSNALTEKIKALGISADDIQTSYYSVHENFVWNPDTEAPESQGWIVSQTLTVKVRDTSKVSALLAAAGQNGATNVYGPSFTIDDPSQLEVQAREEAVADAASKAAQLAATLGVKLGGVVGYSEYSGGSLYSYESFSMADSAKAYGGAPGIEPGTNQIDLTVSITYRILE